MGFTSLPPLEMARDWPGKAAYLQCDGIQFSMTDEQPRKPVLSPKRELANAMGASAISRALAMLAALTLNALIARQLPSSDYAYLGVLIAISAIFMVVLQMGYQTSIVRVAGEAIHDDEWNKLSAGLLAGTLAVGAATAILFPVFLVAAPRFFPTPSVGGPDIGLLALTAVHMAMMALNIFYAEALRGLGRVGAAATLSGSGQHGGIARGLLLLAIAMPLALMNLLSLKLVLGIGIAASCMTALVSLRMLARYCPTRPTPGLAWQQFRDGFSQNATILSAEFLQLVAGLHMATLVGSTILPVEALALFVAAMQLANILGAPLLLFNGSSPKLLIAAYRSGNLAELESLLRIGASMALVFCAGAAAVLVGGGSSLFGLIFGDRYASAATLFALLVPGLLFSAFGGTAARLLLLLGFERSYLRFSIASAVIVPLSFVFAASAYGSHGLALAASLVLLAQNTVLVIIVRRLVGVWTIAYLNPGKYVHVIKRILAEVQGRIRRG